MDSGQRACSRATACALDLIGQRDGLPGETPPLSPHQTAVTPTDRPSWRGLGAVADKRQRGTPKSGGGATLAAIASFARIGISIHNRQRRREQGGRAGRVSRSTEIPIFRFQDY